MMAHSGMLIKLGKHTGALLLKSLVLYSCLMLSTLTGAQQITQLSEPFASQVKKLANAPQELIDNLLQNAPDSTQADVIHAQYHWQLSRAYYNLTYPQKSLEHVQRALTLVEESSQPWLYHSLKIMEAEALELVGVPLQGMAGVNAAIRWAQQNEQNKMYLEGLFARGILQISLTDYLQALDDFQQAYALAGDNPNELSKAHVAAMLAQVYEYRDEPALAIPYYQEAVEAHRLHQADLDLSIALFGLGKANLNINNLTLAQQQLQESASLAEKIEDWQGVAYALKELAAISLHDKNYQDAENKLLKAVSIFSEANNRHMNFNLMLALANLALESNNLAQAEKYLQDAGTLLDRENMPLHAIGYDEFYSKILALQGHYQQAYDTIKQAFQHYKKYHNVASSEQLHQLRSRFEVQLTQQENQVLTQQNALQQSQLATKKAQNLQLILLTISVMVVCGLLAIIIFRNKAHKRRLEALATRDELTGLYNRRQTMNLLEQRMALAARHGKGLCIAMLDIDWFKQINDSYGHAAGDKVLREFATLCQSSLRDSDIVGRVGGEEFLLILNHTRAAAAFKVLNQLRVKMASLTDIVGFSPQDITVSVGVVEYQDNDSLEDLILLADTALYRAKNNGRDQVVLCDRHNVERANTQ